MPGRNGQLHAKEQPPQPPRIAIIVSRYNASITDRLLSGALEACPGPSEIVDAPGSFELPALAHAAAATGRFDGVLALGCIIKGETSHDKYIAHAVAGGLVQATIATGVPIAFGVLTVDTPEQALARAGGPHGNKGRDSMHALLETVHQIARLRAGRPAAPPAASQPRPDKAASVARSRAGTEGGGGGVR